MQRVLNVYDWAKLGPDDQMAFKSSVPDLRPVRLRVNAPSPVALYLKQPDFEDPLFLARAEGLDEVQFFVQGDFTLIPSGEVWFHTLDGDRGDVEAVDPTSFTNIVERRARNLEFEIMELKAAQNMERRLAAIQASFDAQLARMEAARVDSAKITSAASISAQPSSSVGADSAASGDAAASGVGGGADGS